MSCPDHAHNQRKLFEAAGTDGYQEILSTGKRLRAEARWVMSEGLLAQFSLAKEQTNRAEGRVGNEVEEEEEEEEGEEVSDRE